MFTRDGLKWREWELEILRDESNTAAEIARAVNRNIHSVHNKASKLGISLVRHICRRCGKPMIKYTRRYRCKQCHNRGHKNG